MAALLVGHQALPPERLGATCRFARAQPVAERDAAYITVRLCHTKLTPKYREYVEQAKGFNHEHSGMGKYRFRHSRPIASICPNVNNALRVESAGLKILKEHPYVGYWAARPARRIRWFRDSVHFQPHLAERRFK
jgi:hypothetical protein